MSVEKLTLSSEDEERADRLHANSIVVNGYGGPFSAPRSLRVWRTGRLRENGEWIPPTDKAVKDYLIPDLRAGGVDCIVAAASSPDDLALWLREFQTSASDAMLAVTAEEVYQAQHDGRISFILGAGGASGQGVEQDLNRILLFHRAGVRTWALTHSSRNLISDGCGEESGAGLSRFGRLFVEELNRQRILVDVSHISDTGFWDVLELSTAPVIATHSNCRAICDHPRNLTDEMIKSLAQRGGHIGLNFFPDFVHSNNPTVFDLVNHIDHISELVGPQYVGLGPDFCAGRWGWVMQSWWARGSSDHNAQRGPLEYPHGVEDVTSMKNVTRALVYRGYSDEEITGILGANFLRLFAEVTGG